MFALAARLFDVKVVAADGAAPVWHEDAVLDPRRGTGARAASTSTPTRPAEKRWRLDGRLSRRSRTLAGPGEDVRLPIACRSATGLRRWAAPLADDVPEGDVVPRVRSRTPTHADDRRPRRRCASTTSRTQWTPSQFMENCATTSRRCGATPATGRPTRRCPKTSLTSSRRAPPRGQRHAAPAYFGLTDLALHDGYQPSAAHTSATSAWSRRPARCCAAAGGPLSAPSATSSRGICGRLLQLRWAEVLSADAFGAFEDAGLDDPAGPSYGTPLRDTVLALGGSRHPMKVSRRSAAADLRPRRCSGTRASPVSDRARRRSRRSRVPAGAHRNCRSWAAQKARWLSLGSDAEVRAVSVVAEQLQQVLVVEYEVGSLIEG